MEERIKSAFLLDTYGPLLTERQRSVMGCFLFEDLSVSEIAAEFSISRQAASEMIRRTQAILESYEKKLQLFEKSQRGIELLDMLESKAEGEEEKSLIQSLREAL